MTTTLYSNLALFDGLHDGFTPDSWFTVDDATGKVAATGTGATPAADRTVDCAGQYVMPGMMNCHVHLGSNAHQLAASERSETETTLLALQNLSDLVHSGVTYVRNLSSNYDVDVKLRDAQAEYGFPAPHVVASGRAMSATGGHGDSPHHTGNESYLVDSPDEMRHAVRQAFKNGADVIKVMATGGVMSVADSPLDAEFTQEELAVATREAHARRRKVAAHAQGTAGIRLALEAGVDSVEHGIFLDEDEAEFMKAHQVYLVPTLNAVQGIIDHGEGKIPDYMVRKASDFAQAFFKNMKMAVQRGVPFATGTDAGTPFNDFTTGYWDELHLLVNKVGMAPQDVLYAATRNSADLLGVSEEYGALAAGKYADFLVLKANPLDDVDAVRQADKGVYLGGKRV